MKARIRKQRKTAGRTRAARRKPAPKPRKPATPVKPKAGSRVPAVADPLDAMIDAATAALSLPIDPAWKSAVRMNLQVTLGHAALVGAFALDDDTEPAPVFKA
jgi:hypothetical protein